MGKKGKKILTCYERSNRKWSSTLSGIRFMPVSDRIWKPSKSNGSRSARKDSLSKSSNCLENVKSFLFISSPAEKSVKASIKRCVLGVNFEYII